jgi:hypothetical protein
MKALVRIDTGSYYYVVSRHRTSAAAEKALARIISRLAGGSTWWLMYEVCDVGPAKKGTRARVGAKGGAK